MSYPQRGGQVTHRESFAAPMGTPEESNSLFKGINTYTSGGQAMLLNVRPSPQVSTPSQGGRIHFDDPTYTPYGPPPTYGPPPIFVQEDPSYGVFPPLGGGQGGGCPRGAGLQDKFPSTPQLQDQLKVMSGQLQSLALASQSQAVEIEVGRKWRLEIEEAVLSSQQQSVVMEQCDHSQMNLRWQTKQLLLGKMKSFSNKRLLKTVLEDLKMLEDLSMVWRSLMFSGDEVSITAVNCDEANRGFPKQNCY
jgi:tellurite resistance-related uncharacterized protein